MYLDANGALVAQHDSEPVDGLRPTTNWSVNEIVEDRHAMVLPADLPVGNYTVVVGLYDANDPALRLATETGDTLPIFEFALR